MYLSHMFSSRRLGIFIGLFAFLVASIAVADIVSGTSTTGTSARVQTTQLTINKPTVATGNFMLASISVNGGSSVTVSAPQGWTQIARTDHDIDVSLISYWKIATASEPANYTWTVNAQTQMVGGITPYTGVDSSSPVDAFAGTSGFGSVASTSAITASGPNEEIVALFATDVKKSFGTPSGMTQKYNLSQGGVGASAAAFDVIQAASGTVSSKISNIAGNKSRNWAAQQIALRKQSVSTGIAFVPGSGAWQQNGTGDQTMSVTLTPDANFLVVGVENGNNQGDTVTGVTWNGTPMTLLGKVGSLDGPHPYYTYLYGQMNPASGTHSIVTQGAVGSALVMSTAYKNVRVLPTNVTTNTVNIPGLTGSISGNIVSSEVGSWLAGFGTQNSNRPSSWTGLSGRIDDSDGSGAARGIGDSNGPVNIGDHSILWSGADSSDWNLILVEMLPANS